ncbi:hypothetical protein D9599_02175 [Roseomonas sp. KE2513]|nr:hypothetical protein [Roseomonas sp. KE2513]
MHLSRFAKAALAVLLGLALGATAEAQPSRERPVERRPAPAARQAPVAVPRGGGDVAPQRFIPLAIREFLNDRRIDPLTRAFLIDIAGKRQEDSTLADYRRITVIAPALTELYISTAVLSAFYEFLNLDPTSLFNPQLGGSWQATSTAFDPRNLWNRRCFNIRNLAQSDPDVVKLNDLLNCGDQFD